MSLVYSDISNNDGIIQRIEFKLFGDNGNGKITGNTTLLQKFTSDCNVALDVAFTKIFEADGRWRFDDRNHTTYPILTGDLVSGQADYKFTTDADSNLILDIQKVAVLPNATATVYDEIKPRDIQDEDNSPYVQGDSSITGIPTEYDKLANGIFLYPRPNYAATNGLKLFVSREGNYFTTADTTQMPGFAGIFHEYIVYHVCFNYAVDNGLSGAVGYQERMLQMEKDIEEFYARRSKDERTTFSPEFINYE